MEFNNGMFNIEFIYHPEKKSLHIIEINPRMASQFGDPYEKVNGTNSYEILVALATGVKPFYNRKQGTFKVASSCVLREFENKLVKKLPSHTIIEKLREKYPEIRLEIFAKEGKHLSHELQDSKSNRYGLIHLVGESFVDVKNKLENCLDILNFQLI